MNLDEILKKKKGYFFFKRLFDIVASGLGIIILSPILILISIAIKLDSRGQVLFKQVRIGKDLREFKILKFRSMVVNAQKMGMSITLDKDKRVTRVGKFIRKTKLDELPQLFNVFMGDMSLVGPRPEVPEYVKLYSEEDKKVLLIRPGITDLASIEYRDEARLLKESENPNETYINEIVPAKLALNKKYISKMGFFYDIGLIFKTIFSIGK